MTKLAWMPSRLRGDHAVVRLRIMSSRRPFIAGSLAAFAPAKSRAQGPPSLHELQPAFLPAG